jgi:hypothetical protein
VSLQLHTVLNTFVASALVAVTAFVGAPSVEARTVTGNLAGFQGVTAVDRRYEDTLYVPFTSGTGVLNVNCSNGKYEYNSLLTSGSARRLALAWCRG